jgi:hypothetical protein
MHEPIITVIAETTADLCWQEYQKTKRMPAVREYVERVLSECGLTAASSDTLGTITYATSQRFQNMLLQSRYNDMGA